MLPSPVPPFRFPCGIEWRCRGQHCHPPSPSNEHPLG
jgi:hypothetical protein